MSAHQDAIQSALNYCKTLGATDAQISMVKQNGWHLDVRHQALESLNYEKDQGCYVSVYHGKALGHSDTTDLSEAGIKAACDKAWSIAQFTEADEAFGLPHASDLAWSCQPLIYATWDVSIQAAAGQGLALEADLMTSTIVKDIESISVGSYVWQKMIANSQGFLVNMTLIPSVVSVHSVSLKAKSTEILCRHFVWMRHNGRAFQI